MEGGWVAITQPSLRQWQLGLCAMLTFDGVWSYVQAPHMLMMDEPTNHLDIEVLEALLLMCIALVCSMWYSWMVFVG